MLQSDSDLLCRIAERITRDLLALRVETRLDGRPVVLPAAGLPWFLTVFGRDTLITAYQTVSFGQELARGALLELAQLQGKESQRFQGRGSREDPARDPAGRADQAGTQAAQPVLRHGRRDDAVADPALRVLAVDRRRRTGAAAWPNVLAALEWIDRYGDRDGDGYVEYQTRSPQGLGNQCWRDSWDGVQFADGRLPYLPIATCELQGYVYDAKLRMAELADGPIGDPALAARLRTRRPRCGSGSTGTSGSTSGAATTRSGSTATRSRSTR